MIEQWIKSLKEKSKNAITLIIGDKGTNHAPPGFYSCSKKLDLDNPNLSDFYNIIKKELER